MAEVIKRGNKHIEDNKAKHTCHKCESLVEFNKKDIKGDQRDGDYVQCPVCTAFISSRIVFK